MFEQTLYHSFKSEVDVSDLVTKFDFTRCVSVTDVKLV